MILKFNSLVDPTLIAALYEASNAGVEIELIVRGICCLVPGLKGVSENIRVISIVGRFLEHTRIFYFRNNGNEEAYIGSADLMQRNLDRRVEAVIPVKNKDLIQYLKDIVLHTYSNDNRKARILAPDMTYSFVKPQNNTPLNSQEWLMEYHSKKKTTLLSPH
jgi:polyphosphate kinase